VDGPTVQGRWLKCLCINAFRHMDETPKQKISSWKDKSLILKTKRQSPSARSAASSRHTPRTTWPVPNRRQVLTWRFQKGPDLRHPENRWMPIALHSSAVAARVISLRRRISRFYSVLSEIGSRRRRDAFAFVRQRIQFLQEI